MASETVYVEYGTGATLYWYPSSQALTDWTTYRVAATDSNSEGIYGATLNDTNGSQWSLFVGSSQPSTFNDAIERFTVKDTTVTISSTIAPREATNTVQWFVGETDSETLTTNEDLSAKTMLLTFEDVRGNTVASVVDGSLTKTTTTVSFSKTSAMTASARTLRYYLADTTTEQRYLYGWAVVDP